MPIQQNYPLISEMGLANCITDSSYMSLINTRASEYLQHNPKCAACEHAMQCLGGCRASSLDTTPDDILGLDMAACTLFRGGWVNLVSGAVEKIHPGTVSAGLQLA
jgi:radical SAM protein with 4Fe4S-binding SPASM domain